MTEDINRTRRKGVVLPVALFNLVLGFACASPPDPIPDHSATSSITASGYRVSGIVTDDGGLPIQKARIVVDHGPRLPDLNEATQRVTTATGVDGRYEIFIRPDQLHIEYSPFAMIRAYTLSNRIPGEYSLNALLLDRQGTSAVRNIRLRRTRVIDAGQSIPIAIESDSSLCDIRGVSVTTLCEWVFVRYPADGTLIVEARPEAGSIVPTLQNSGRQGQGTLTLPVNTEDSGSVGVAIAIPVGMAPQPYELSTSLWP